MNLSSWTFAAIALLCVSGAALAQDPDFNLTYHVERTPTAQLGLDACAAAVTQAAQHAGLRSSQQSFPGQLVTVSGGAEGAGAFVAQCIAVDDITVTVIQGIDYRARKGPLGDFADQAFAAIKAAIR